MRLAGAIAVIAVTLSAAVYIHERTLISPACTSFGRLAVATVSACHVPPSWENPVAVLLAIGGVAMAVGIVRFVKTSY